MLKRRSVVSAMAFATLFISSVEVAYAQPSLPLEVELVVVPPTEAELRAAIPGETEPTWPTLLEMSDRSSMLSWDMLMVSVMMKKVEQARTPRERGQLQPIWPRRSTAGASTSSLA